jgi:hypothetical protein
VPFLDKKELIHRRAWPTRADLRTEVFDYIEIFYNRERRTAPSECSPRRSSRRPIPIIIQRSQAA